MAVGLMGLLLLLLGTVGARDGFSTIALCFLGAAMIGISLAVA